MTGVVKTIRIWQAQADLNAAADSAQSIITFIVNAHHV
jgi:hypothetical protein